MPIYDEFTVVPVKKSGGAVSLLKLVPNGQVQDTQKIAEEVLAKSGLREMPENLRQRFLSVIVSRLKDVRDELETRQELSLAADKGGLGFSSAEVDSVMVAISGVTAKKVAAPKLEIGSPKEIQSRVGQAASAPASPRAKLEEVSKKFTAAFPTKPSPPPVKPEIPKPKFEIPIPPAKPEIPKPKFQIPPPPAKAEIPIPPAEPRQIERAPALPASRQEAVTMLANEVMDSLSFRLSEPSLADRLRYAAHARLADVRDALETEETLRRPVNAGGLGLSSAQTSEVLAALLPRVERIQRELYAISKKKVTAALAEEKEKRQFVADVRKEQEKKEIDVLFEEVTGRSAETRPPVPREIIRGLTSTGGQTSTPPVRQPPPTRPPAPTPQLPAAPTMTDVEPPARLIGPIEELRRLNLVDFRKFSKNPAEAARKIRDKLSLLEAESFARRNRGIEALKESELFQTYAAILAQSVTRGISPDESIAQSAAAGRPTLTIEEFNAIMELNKTLRF
ncbi:hypothetical protein EPN90_04735 [Patescibacteria group bacterium]|nr:MAG: hypothetical protein EPN90_04735 [Patescibacteria group bacterium]